MEINDTYTHLLYQSNKISFIKILIFSQVMGQIWDVCRLLSAHVDVIVRGYDFGQNPAIFWLISIKSWGRGQLF